MEILQPFNKIMVKIKISCS